MPLLFPSEFQWRLLFNMEQKEKETYGLLKTLSEVKKKKLIQLSLFFHHRTYHA